MGCANSKQKRCRHCNAPYSPVPRSYSMHVHHPPPNQGDSYHMVALTSSTLGSIKLDSPVTNWQQIPKKVAENGFKFSNGNKVRDSGSFRFQNSNFMEQKEEFSMDLIEAKTWSNMMEKKLPKVIPKTPTRTPPGEPEIINTWELMEGLEDTSPFRSPNQFRSFSFGVNGDVDSPTKSNFIKNDTASPPKPLWLQMATEEEGVISDFDPEVISSFRKSLQELSPDNRFHVRPAPPPAEEEKKGDMVRKGFSFEEEKKSKDDVVVMDFKHAPYGKDKVVLYFTSLRGVRKTYEDCCQVRLILKGLGVCVDERDVSMHSGFKEELKEILGDEFGKGGLPRVFIGRNYIGGAEEIQRLHEDGKLEKLFDSCEKIGDSVGGDVCEACGDIRFVPCETCSGSCKIYYEEEDIEEENGEVGEYGFQRCPDCNENGLIRCPICCC